MIILYNVSYTCFQNKPTVIIHKTKLKIIEANDIDIDGLIKYKNIEDNSISMLRVEKLKEALELISPDERMILLLKYQDLLSIKELAEILELGESAVKMRLKRAKDKLISIYKDVDHG